MSPSLQGVLPVLQTPFDPNDQIDWPVLRREIRWVLRQGAQGVCAAMVSEWLRLTQEERLAYMHEMVQTVEGRGVVVASVGAESTFEARLLAREAQKAGCSALMAIPPISQPLGMQALEDYFRAIAEEVPLPLVVQDASSYVGEPLPLELMVRLLERYGPEKILFKPEAAPLGPNVSALLEATSGKARIFDGSGGIALVDTFRRGIVGTMPGADLVPALVRLWSALQQGQEPEIYRIYLPLAALVALQMQGGLDGFLEVEKYLLVRQGVFSSARCRAPQAYRLDPATQQEVDRLFERLQQALGN